MKVAQILSNLKIDHLLGGSMYLKNKGYITRDTNDVDIVMLEDHYRDGGFHLKLKDLGANLVPRSSHSLGICKFNSWELDGITFDFIYNARLINLHTYHKASGTEFNIDREILLSIINYKLRFIELYESSGGYSKKCLRHKLDLVDILKHPKTPAEIKYEIQQVIEL